MHSEKVNHAQLVQFKQNHHALKSWQKLLKTNLYKMFLKRVFFISLSDQIGVMRTQNISTLIHHCE